MTTDTPIALASQTFTALSASAKVELLAAEVEHLIANVDLLAPLRSYEIIRQARYGIRGKQIKLSIKVDPRLGGACKGWASYSRPGNLAPAHPIGLDLKIGPYCSAHRAAELVAHELTHQIAIGEHHNRVYRMLLGRVLASAYGLPFDPYVARRCYAADDLMAARLGAAWALRSIPAPHAAPMPRAAKRPTPKPVAPVGRPQVPVTALKGKERLIACLSFTAWTSAGAVARLAGCSSTYAAKTLPKLVAEGRVEISEKKYRAIK